MVKRGMKSVKRRVFVCVRECVICFKKRVLEIMDSALGGWR